MLMRPWMRSIAAKAPLMARARPDSGAPLCAAISTKVPSNGRHRRNSLFEDEFMQGQQTPNAIRNVTGGKRGAGNILDVVVKFKLRAVFLAGELCAPFLSAHLATVRLAIVHHFDLLHGAIFSQADRVGDELVLANDLIKHKPAAAFDLPDLLV